MTKSFKGTVINGLYRGWRYFFKGCEGDMVGDEHGGLKVYDGLKGHVGFTRIKN